MNIEIDPAEVEILCVPDPRGGEGDCAARYRGHVFHARVYRDGFSDREHASASLEEQVAAMSAHARLDFLSKTRQK